MREKDDSERLLHLVQDALARQQPLALLGSGSKHFLGPPGRGGTLLSVSEHSGVIDYAPSELMLRARAGTALTAITQLLDAQGQMLPFEPPQFGGQGTLGGALATGLAGPGRPWRGSVRDAVLGVEIINGLGQRLQFGGQVMKNVAGFDVSRLMAGAFGTLGLVLSLSVRLVPKPETELTRVFQLSPAQAQDWHLHLGRQPEPVTASCYDGENLYLRLSGSLAAVAAAASRLGGSEDPEQGAIWQQLRDQRHPALSQGPLWRCLLPVDAPDPWPGRYLVEWGGRQRWLQAALPGPALMARCQELGGHASLFRAGSDELPLPQQYQAQPDPVSLHYQQQIKLAFDPQGIFNPGRLYPEF